MTREMSRWGVGPSTLLPTGAYAAFAGLATWLWPEVCVVTTVPRMVFLVAGIVLLVIGVPMLVIAGRAATIAYNSDKLATTAGLAPFRKFTTTGCTLCDGVRRHWLKSADWENPRIHGNPPLSVVVLHGGPGALGGMSRVASELADAWGVLEPIQTAASVTGQVEELRSVVVERGHTPVVMIGSSWGAMLGFIFSARYPTLVRKLILVGSGVYEQQYAAGILDTRLNRLDERQRQEAILLMKTLGDPAAHDKDLFMARLGSIFASADACDSEALSSEVIECRYDLHRAVWADAEQK